MAREPVIIRDEKVRQYVQDLISKLNLEKPWAVTVEPYRKKRTLSQNALYWKWVAKIADETGNTNDAVHDALKDMFLAPQTITLGGNAREVRTTVALTVPEMKDYMDKVQAFAASELGLFLPLPEEQHTRAA